MFVAATLAAPLLTAPAPVSAEGLFDFFFGGIQKLQRQAPATSWRSVHRPAKRRYPARCTADAFRQQRRFRARFLRADL